MKTHRYQWDTTARIVSRLTCVPFTSGCTPEEEQEWLICYRNDTSSWCHREALCRASSMLGYLAICLSTLGSLFLFQDGSLLSRPRLVNHYARPWVPQEWIFQATVDIVLDQGSDNSCEDGCEWLSHENPGSLEVLSFYAVHSDPMALSSTLVKSFGI